MTVAERRFDAAIEHAAYLVCSEALANVAKHAGATRVTLRTEVVRGCLRLEVSDNGQGGANVAGSGLGGIVARVDELGGHVTVDSPAGHGTRLAVEIPLAAGRASTDPGGPSLMPGRLASAVVG